MKAIHLLGLLALFGLSACFSNPFAETCLGETLPAQAKTYNLDQAVDLVAEGKGLEKVSLAEGVEREALVGLFEGKVVEVCQMSGCWFVLDRLEGSPIHFSVKKPAFKMPATTLGTPIKVYAYLYKDQISVEELRANAREEGLDEESIAAITEPETVYQALALGVCHFPFMAQE